MMNPSVLPSPLVEVTRGNVIESIHYGHYAVAVPDGSIVEGSGNVDFVTYPRSALKLIQALQLVESGAADAYRLKNQHLSLACSSHWAEAFHVEAICKWLNNLSCTEDDLLCGRDFPYDEVAKEELLRQNGDRRKLFHNCSGKHAGFLTTCRHLSYDIDCYDTFQHPSQVRYREDLSLLTQTNADQYPWGIDGCSLPAPALPMGDVARAMAKLTSSKKISDSKFDAINRLCSAVAEKPEYFWGTKAPCTELAQITRGRLIAKIGAEGYMAVIVRDKGLGISIKVSDGSRRAVIVALFGVLKKLGLLKPREQNALQHHIKTPLTNTKGKIVGGLQPSLETFV